MPKYLISYRKTEGGGQKPEWTSFTTQSETSLEAHAIRERVDRRMSVLGEQLWGSGEVSWVGNGRLDDVLYRREEAAPEMSIVYGLVEE
jgi:carbamoyl-phosphate synthase large subunit